MNHLIFWIAAGMFEPSKTTWLLLLSFVLGMLTSVTIYQDLRLHRFSWEDVIVYAGTGFAAFRYARAFYRRLGR